MDLAPTYKASDPKNAFYKCLFNNQLVITIDLITIIFFQTRVHEKINSLNIN